ncbi:putative acetyltransferase [Aequoribacter fuscus]|uniref:Putative acetyltransferase n=1 Tax=Aequoribacter fuscus TaxID=2518989 RepID=F3L3R5_9GAMM|nr:putative acetyltransferase [Aequoribacter fuscus]
MGAGAVINKDVKPFALMVGVPAKQIGWISIYGEQLKLPLEGSGIARCEYTGEQYQLENGFVSIK